MSIKALTVSIDQGSGHYGEISVETILSKKILFQEERPG